MATSFREAEFAGWSTRAAAYDQHFTPITNQVIPPIMRLLEPLSGKQVLDVCCGPGHLSAAVAAQGATVKGLDFSASMVARARVNYANVEFLEGDAEELPFAAEEFDRVVCAYGVMHFSRPDAAIAEAYRVLRPHGRYLFTQWAQDDDVLQIVFTALAQHGEPTPELPVAPPPMRLSDPAECQRILEASGFSEVRHDRVEIAWNTRQPEDLLQMIYGGAVRAAMVLEAQVPARRERIHHAIIEAAKAREVDGRIVIRRPTVIAIGTKAAND